MADVMYVCFACLNSKVFSVKFGFQFVERDGILATPREKTACCCLHLLCERPYNISVT